MARLVFLGTPPAAAVSLEALVHAGHDVVLVVSRADARRGRGTTHSPSPVKRAALELGIEVTDRLDDLPATGAELGVVVAYGRLVPGRILDVLPMVNVHFSLLPRWRGAAPVERAVLAGDTETGVGLMRLEQSLDTGPVLAQRRVTIGAREHVSALTNRLATIGAELLVDTLAVGVDSLPAGAAQQGEPTYAEKVRPEELRLNWWRAASELERVVRLDRAWTTFRHERLRVLDAVVRSGPLSDENSDAPVVPGTLEQVAVRTGDGVLELVEVQPAGKRPMSASAWCRGVRVEAGETLGGDE
ncbi:MAG TPA: methionyl-tRNA formyltransferase [Acidimicrobiales bacterium]|nr:methionyl-tRNA formyltransferase [Acidimicrobiales bacterium]